MGLYFGLFFPVNRERDGFALMGFSQQLASEQTRSKPVFTEFLPAPPPPPKGPLVSHQPGLEVDTVPPVPFSTPAVEEGGLEDRDLGWPRRGQVHSSLALHRKALSTW